MARAAERDPDPQTRTALSGAPSHGRPPGCHVLTGPHPPARIGNLLQSPGVFLTLTCSIRILGCFVGRFEGFQHRSGPFPLTCLFLPHVHLAWSGVSGGSWERREPDAPRATTRRKRPCEMRCQVPPEAGGGGGKVGESEAPGLRVFGARCNLRTWSQTSSETRKHWEGRRQRVFTTPNLFHLKANRWPFIVRLSNSVGRAFFLKND